MENSKNLKEQIKNVIRENKINTALELLTKLYKNHSDENIIIQLRAQYRKLQDDKLSGIISRQDQDIEISKIRNRVLELVDRFQTDTQINPSSSNSDINRKTITGDIKATNVYIGDNIYSTNRNDKTENKQKWYQKYSSLLKILISLAALIVAIVILLYGNNILGRISNTNNEHIENRGKIIYDGNESCKLLPFSQNDSILNILITKFENVSNNNDTKCIGKSIQERIYNLKQNKNLRVNVTYCDTIASPTDPDIAKKLRIKYNTDLLLYGTADVKEICTDNPKFRFKYTFTDSISNLSSHQTSENILSFKNFEDLFTGELQIDRKNLEAWLLPYIALKDEDIDQAIKLFVDKKRRQITDITLEEIYSFAAHRHHNYPHYNYFESKKYLNKILRINNKNISARRHLIFIYEIQNNCMKVKEHSDTLFSITKFLDDELCSNRSDFLRIGVANESCGSCDKVIEYLTNVIEYKPECKQYEIRVLANCTIDSDLLKAHLTRGKCYAKLGKTIKAAQDFKKVIELDINKEKDVEELIEQYEL